MPFEDGQDPGYNSMQQQAGLLPTAIAAAPPAVFPGQITAMLASGGPGAAMSLLQPINPFANAGFGGMGGYPTPSPMPSRGFGTSSSLFAPVMPPPPPLYAGPQVATSMFAPPPPPPMFNTPYGAMAGRQMAEEQQNFANNFAYGGIGARIAATVGAGVIGAHYGGRFGGVVGASVGGLAAMAGSEYFGGGQFAQNQFMDQFAAPALQRRGFAAGIEHMSPGFIPFGPGPMGGFNSEQSMAAAGRITDMANSAAFRRETFDRFNASDVAGIAQGAGHVGMLSGVRDVEGMASRVRDVAKSLNAFMELANEPDIQRAIHTMGNLRATGLNLSETLGAVQSGRSFARLAGTSFQDMLEIGGGAGASVFQATGMSAGLGTRAGMANYGMSAMSQNTGIINPALMSMLRGPQGLAASSNMFSANMLNMPMLAPAMMTSTGGLNLNSLQSLAAGGGNLFEMTGRGSSNLTNMTQQMGIGGLGMAVGMQPLLRDIIGRMLQSQGPSVQRNMEDAQITGLMRQMNLSGSSGFITAAQMAGASESEAVARAQQVGSPTFYAAQRATSELRRREAREASSERREARMGGAMDLIRSTAAGEVISGIEHLGHSLSRGLSRATAGEEYQRMTYDPTTDDAMRRQDDVVRDRGFQDYMRRRTRTGYNQQEAEYSIAERLRRARTLSRGSGGAGIVSGIETVTGAIGFSENELRAASRGFAEGGAMTEELLFSSVSDQRSAAQNMGSTFGEGARGIQAAAAFSRRIASMRHLHLSGGAMALNAAFRAAPMATGIVGGLLDPGNLIGHQARQGEDYRQALREAVRESGGDAESAVRAFNRDPRTFLRQSAPLAAAMMSPEDIRNLEHSMGVGRDARSLPGAALRGFQEDRDTAMRDLLGRDAGRGTSAALTGALDAATGVGRRGSNKFERSRIAITAIAAASATIGDSPSARAAGERAIEQIAAQLGREGFDQVEIGDIARRGVALSGSRFAGGEGRGAAQALMRTVGGRSGEDLLNQIQGGEFRYRRAQAGTDIASSLHYLRAAGGPLADLAGSMTADTFDQTKFDENLLGIAGDQGRLRDLSQRGTFGRRAAQLLERYAQGGRAGEAAHGELMEILARQGRSRNEVEREVSSRFTNRALTAVGRAGAGIASIFGGSSIVDQYDTAVRRHLDREIAGELTATSQGERNAAREGLNSSAAETAMRALGIGRSDDQLLQAATELRRVAELFRDTIDTGSLPTLLDPQSE